MTGWSSRRSGSRLSIHNPVRRVLQALCLSRNPMPPRITRISDRPRASDRTMVGPAQPLCLSALGANGRRYESAMNLRKRKTQSVSFHDWGWTARPFSRGLTVVREVFVLTSPFIERGYRNVEIRSSERQKPHSDTIYLDLGTTKNLQVCNSLTGLYSVNSKLAGAHADPPR